MPECADLCGFTIRTSAVKKLCQESLIINGSSDKMVPDTIYSINYQMQSTEIIEFFFIRLNVFWYFFAYICFINF